MDTPICGTPITCEQVLHHLRIRFGPQIQLESFESDTIGVGEGMVSNLLRLRLKWAIEDARLPKSIIVKAPTLGHVENISTKTEVTNVDDMIGDLYKDAVLRWVFAAHNVECRVYEMLCAEGAPIPIPKCYGTVEMADGRQGMLIIEDLSQKAAISPSFLDGMTHEQVVASVDEIARLQAWSLITPIDWRPKVHTMEDFVGFLHGYVTLAPAVVAEMMNKYPEELGSIDLEPIKVVIQLENVIKIWTEHREAMDDVFVHGDYHKNNILFEKNEDGSVSNRLAAIIDFQGAMSGSPAADLVRMMVFSVPQLFRQEHELELLRRYYDSIKSLAGESFKPSFEQMLRWYRRNFLVQAILLVVWIPAIMVFAVKSDGDQRKTDEKRFLQNVMDALQHGIKNYNG